MSAFFLYVCPIQIYSGLMKMGCKIKQVIKRMANGYFQIVVPLLCNVCTLNLCFYHANSIVHI